MFIGVWRRMLEAASTLRVLAQQTERQEVAMKHLIALAVLAASFAAAAQTSYIHSGNTTFGSDGSFAIRSGNTTFVYPGIQPIQPMMPAPAPVYVQPMQPMMPAPAFGPSPMPYYQAPMLPLR